MIKLAISGCQGRMGMRIMHLAQEDEDFKIVDLLEKKNHPAVNGQAGGVVIEAEPIQLKEADVLIEFTSPEATMEHLEECIKNDIRMIIGTTGLSEEQIQKINNAALKIPIVFAANMSIGVNIFFGLTRQVAEKSKGLYSFRIQEAHHEHKKDKPSGTAKTIAKIIEEACEQKVSDIQSLREGEIIGDHELILESETDTITIKHHAKTRDIFAKGALEAAKYIVTKKEGLYNMQDVLALK